MADDIGIEAFFDTRTATVTYLVWDPQTGFAAVIDPVLDYDPKSGRLWLESVDKVLAAAQARKLTIERVLETHAHADHLSGAQAIKHRLAQHGIGVRVAAGARIVEVQGEFAPRFAAFDLAEQGADFDDLYEDGAAFHLGRLSFRVMSTPGHTPACVTYVVADAAFVGDALFMPDFGTPRCDFPGGDAHALWRSIQRIFALPPQTRLFTGHDYPSGAGRAAPAWESTVAQQRASNRHVKDGTSEADFIAMRTARDRELEPPVLLLPALQVNIRAGKLPPADPGGRTFLRIPVDPAALD
ncbi:MAG TPA: MBL fold metallo-hydrolase [Caulobacteraceae bacterium]|jgi:glyoxylase-like metal-dependent hydrolase (beta-lactamase superfamily II)